jgi:hypothetical protein
MSTHQMNASEAAAMEWLAVLLPSQRTNLALNAQHPERMNLSHCGN